VKYLLLIYDHPDAYPPAGSPEHKAVEDAYWAYEDATNAAGALVDSHALEDAAQSRTVRVRNGETLITDGPFIESKEHISGYFLIEAGSIDEAVAWAAKNPGATYGAVEVRPIFVFDART